MKKIAFFCIPAYGHTNPMLPVAQELVRRGGRVRFYSFDEFREKILAAGAEFVSCSRFLPALDEKQKAGVLHVSTTEMTIQDIRITLAMDAFLGEEMRSFRPDAIYTDSVCFWGKLSAWKYRIPMVVSTSTFAFNQLSSQYMKNSPREMADMLFGLPKISRELKKLRQSGYPVKSALSLVESDNRTDTVVYTSRRFQPYAGSFSAHYAFVGPSVFSQAKPDKAKARPLVYISMGTVLNDRPDFYKNCIAALRELDADVLISCGQYMRQDELGTLPEHVRACPYVDQLEVLARADVFITHCGMNSVSESLYMATPMVLYPQTGEQRAVARRAAEAGAGVFLREDTPEHIRDAVQKILRDKAYAEAAAACSADFRACSGPADAASFIENAPHTVTEKDPLAALNRQNGIFQLLYWAAAGAALFALGAAAGWRCVWPAGILAGVGNSLLGRRVRQRNAHKLMEEPFFR